jgi:hypothetical protein
MTKRPSQEESREMLKLLLSPTFAFGHRFERVSTGLSLSALILIQGYSFCIQPDMHTIRSKRQS